MRGHFLLITERGEKMLDTILSVVGALLAAFAVYALVMCVWLARQISKAEKEFWEQHTELTEERRERV